MFLENAAYSFAVLAALADLHRAINGSELVPSFQPIVELRTGRLAGFEVLARWQHPQHGLILPGNFIALAEKNGLIGNLMCQILSKAFESVSCLPDPLTLAVNVSPVQLRDLTLPRQIRQLAEQAGFPLERLHVEITESALVDNIDRAQTITRELKAMGCQLAMDDFGTGYSSLRNLQILHFDVLKVDRSFLASMSKERESRKIVATIIGLGHSLGLANVAEGVETEEQANVLQLLGCEYGQGWLYGKPQPVESIPAMVANGPRVLSTGIAKKRDDALSGLEALPTQRLAQLKAIYDGCPIGLCFLDRNLRHVSINQHLADMNGAPVSAHIGRTVQEMLPELFPRVEPYLRRALKGEAISRVEVCQPSNNCERSDQTILVSYQPAFDESGEVIGVSLSLLDVSEWQRVEWHRDAQTGSCSCFAALGFNAPQKRIQSLLAGIVGTSQH